MSFWLDKGVLVTSATGLVGSWLTRSLLDAGADRLQLRSPNPPDPASPRVLHHRVDPARPRSTLDAGFPATCHRPAGC